MKLDITLFPDDLRTFADIARRAESLGFDGLWTAEAAHNPFLPLPLGFSVTDRLMLGTQIAVAFARSPMVTANLAWDLQQQSGGRFILGLGTQVKAHIRRRFSMEWGEPVKRLREYIESLRAIWDTWQNNAPLQYKGEHYQFSLMTPFFSPAPILHLNIPIYIAGVNEKNCRLAGEICDGLHAHGFHTIPYLQGVVMSNVNVGLQSAGRERSAFELVVPIFTVTGRTDADLQQSVIETKSRIAFYASTPSYAVVMETHGWMGTHERLSMMARRGAWDSMWQEISDEMLDEIAVVAPSDELRAKITARYAGLADRLCLGWDAGEWFLNAIAPKTA